MGYEQNRVSKAFVLVIAAAAGLAGVRSALAALPPVPVPPENPITEAKRVLGKALFWDEQLSSDNTVACATCHTPGRAGKDARRVRTPGIDSVPNTPDDVFGSPGVIHQDALSNYRMDNTFQLAPQATTRSANAAIMAAFAPMTFWDGRGSGTFRDPVTNQVLIANGGALESQIVNPPVSSVEMAHEQRNWGQITAKLQTARPLALATALTPDLAGVIQSATTYANLFEAAFGNSQVTAARIAFAIATYERTLIPDQTPWDRFNAGDLTALTPQQQQGFQRLQVNNCTVCHSPPTFADPIQTFRNIGLRPIAEDTGRQAVTGNINDRGKFKVPSLRNVALSNTFMHNGMFTTLQEVFGFYDRAPGTQQFPDNRDPIMPAVRMPPPDGGLVQDFLTNGLVDPRVRNETFPFDHPVLWSSPTRVADRPTILPGGTSGSGGVIPNNIVNSPPFVGNDDFKIGIRQALGGATARVAVSFAPPVNGRVRQDKVLGPFTLAGTGAANGYGTAHLPLAANGALSGRILFMQWIVTDAGAAGGQAFGAPVRVTPFCAGAGCPRVCVADIDDGSGIGLPDGGVGIEDLTLYLDLYADGVSRADFDNGSGNGIPDGGVGIEDLLFFLDRYDAGC